MIPQYRSDCQNVFDYTGSLPHPWDKAYYYPSVEVVYLEKTTARKGYMIILVYVKLHLLTFDYLRGPTNAFN